MTRHPARHRIVTIGIIALLMLLWVTLPASAANIYWTGEGDNNLWSNTNNWHGGVLPGLNDAARIGNATYVTNDAPITIVLDMETEIDQLILEGTGQRTILIQAQDDEVLKVLANAGCVVMAATATADAVLDLPVLGSLTNGYSNYYIQSPSASLIVGPSGSLDYSFGYGSMLGGGTLVIQGELISRWQVWQNCTVIIDEGSAVPFLGSHYAMLDGTRTWIKQDTAIGSEMRGSGTSYIDILDSGSTNRTFTMGNARGVAAQVVTLGSSPSNSTGHLTVRVGSLLADGLAFNVAEGATLEFYGGSRSISTAANAGVSGTGNLRLALDSTANVLTVRRALTYTGRTMLDTGILRLLADGSLPTNTVVEIGSSAGFDLNGFNQRVGGISDYYSTAGEVLLGGATLTVHAETASAFSGTISGTGAFIKTGSQTFTLAAGYTNAVDRTLRVAGGVLAVTGALSVEEGDFELAGGRITAGSLASEGAVWNVTLHAANEGQVLVDVDGNADITGATLNLALADGYAPAYGKEYTLLYAGTLTGAEKDGDLFQYEDGDTFFDGDQEYLISWADGSEKIILTAIPEPGSLLLLLPAAAGLWLRRRARR